MKTCTIIGGVSDVGKTSFIGVLQHYTTDSSIIINVDKTTVQHGGNAMEGSNRAVEVYLKMA